MAAATLFESRFDTLYKLPRLWVTVGLGLRLRGSRSAAIDSRIRSLPRCGTNTRLAMAEHGTVTRSIQERRLSGTRITLRHDA